MKTLDATYFTGEILIPNLTGTDFASTGRMNRLTWYINKYVPRGLALILGEDLADTYLTEVAKQTPGAEWTALENLLFVTAQTGPSFSPLAHYVFYQYTKGEATQLAESTETVQNKENATVVGNSRKTVKAWNEFVTMSEDIWEYIEEHLDLYADFGPDYSVMRHMNGFGI